MAGPVMITYKNLASGRDVAYEAGSRMDRKAASSPQKFKRLTKTETAKPDKPEKSG